MCTHKIIDLIKSDNVLYNHITFSQTFLCELYNKRENLKKRVLYDKKRPVQESVVFRRFSTFKSRKSRAPLSCITGIFIKWMSKRDLIGEITKHLQKVNFNTKGHFSTLDYDQSSGINFQRGHFLCLGESLKTMGRCMSRLISFVSADSRCQPRNENENYKMKKVLPTAGLEHHHLWFTRLAL